MRNWELKSKKLSVNKGRKLREGERERERVRRKEA